MTSHRTLNNGGQQLRAQLVAASAQLSDDDNQQYINVAGVGGLVSTAYEQLRNAAEYAQEHLLIQNAIRRFYARNLSFHTHTEFSKTLAEELVIELTQSGYLRNNTQPVNTVDKLNKVIRRHYDNYWRLKNANTNDDTARNWTLDLLSLGSEDTLALTDLQSAYLQFAYNHYKDILPKDFFVTNNTEESNYEVSLYIAVHKALLKSDLASVRYDMQKLYKVSDETINDYARFHQNIDEVFNSDLTGRIVLHINKYGAPLRVLRSLIQDNEDASEFMASSEQFDAAYSAQIKREYGRAESKLSRGLFKSILFLLITKSLIGLIIEVPYDLYLTGEIIWVPLLLNLLSPVAYLAFLRLGFQLPGSANARAMSVYAEEMMYGDPKSSSLYPRPRDMRYPIGFKIAYAALFMLVFGLVTYLLIILGFNLVQGVMFFVFMAAASFLGFRLSRIVRELELVVAKPGILMTLRDIIFTPFTFLGKWISDKYQKINIVALVLDTFIEMPLKTVLRLIRQWTGFIDDKRDNF